MDLLREFEEPIASTLDTHRPMFRRRNGAKTAIGALSENTPPRYRGKPSEVTLPTRNKPTTRPVSTGLDGVVQRAEAMSLNCRLKVFKLHACSGQEQYVPERERPPVI